MKWARKTGLMILNRNSSEKYGYSAREYLPVFTGRVVNSAEESNRFLWDLRRSVADAVAYEYVGGLAKNQQRK
jgi:hypothetical protein